MQRLTRKRTQIAILIIGLLLLAWGRHWAWAATAESKFHQAERCYRQLLHSPAQQKYRDRWLRCIGQFLDAYKHNPRGRWAAVSLYQAGLLYSELYKKSFSNADKQEALDIFSRVTRRYPDSHYRVKADQARSKIADPGPAASAEVENSAVRKWYEKAQAQYQRLQQKPGLQKYRDQWLKCIDYYRKAYQAERQGPLAAAALYGLAHCYEELHRRSYLDLDRIQSQKSYAALIQEFPNSPYAEKARAVIGPRVAEDASDTPGDTIAGVIENARTSEAPTQVPVPGVSAQKMAVVEGLRFWSNPRYTRVVIDADQDTIFTYRELREDPAIGKPQRIYIDVHNSRLSGKLQKVVPINDDLLSDARAGQYNADIVRVVVDIKSFKTFKIFSLKSPFRIVLDVWGIDTERPSETVQPDFKADRGKKIPPSALVKQLALGVRRIVVDPGHGGKDYGAPGYIKGVHEKDVALQIAKRLAMEIRSKLKCDVVLTRDKDEYLSLEERTAIANTQNADLFISIHTNATADRRAYGIETFILNLATDDEAIRVAARENATSTNNISDLDSILKDLMQNAKVNESTRLASYVQQDILKSLKHKYSSIRSNGVKQAPFYVLLGAQMPSILVETSFISHPRECKRLTNRHYQEQLVHGIVQGVKQYIEETNPTAFNKQSAGKGHG